MRDAGAKKAKNTRLRSTQGQMPLGAIFMLRWWFIIERLAVCHRSTIHQGHPRAKRQADPVGRLHRQ